jgi:hypothetical protein
LTRWRPLDRLTRVRRNPSPGTRFESRTTRQGRMSVSHPHSAASIAGHDAPLIDARAGSRGRIATGGGDEHAGVKRSSPRRYARGERRDQGRTRSSMTYRPPWEGTPGGSMLARHRSKCTARENRVSFPHPHAHAFIAGNDARPSGTAAPRAGAAQRRLAMMPV